MDEFRLIISDLVMSFMWVCSGALIKILVYHVLGWGFQAKGEALKVSLYVVVMFFFAWFGKVSRGGSYNPLSVLSQAISGRFSDFVFTLFGRIPAQVIGSIIGVRLIIATFPEVGKGPRLNVDIHHGALVEGLLTLSIVMISQFLRNGHSGFFMKTWISSLSKLSLHILGSDLTGGCMNPASVFGWAFARGDHITKEHWFVYWLAPVEATLLGVWIFSLLSKPQKQKRQEKQPDKTIKAD
ncbi:putative aquaporin SIP2-1 [Acorus gramineus]|uniref:Aquaporin SIP2-1 n=1 Tax=Acorus gramineus TaxID=55184 RepID=A0AAV8ZVH6_ACOGR|nr:putative aquaporin SIP2-1 [Acorus gramineus]